MNASRSRIVLTILIALVAMPALAAPYEFVGAWQGGDRAAMSIYGTLRISSTHIAWSGKADRIDPRCTFEYTIEREPDGVFFGNQSGHKYRRAPGVPTYLLRLGKGNCETRLTHLRLTLERGPGQLAMIEYEALDRPVGYLYFFRYDPDPRSERGLFPEQVVH